jgi:thiol:disulfide interchange protein DsbD
MKKYFFLIFMLLAFSLQARPGLLDSLGFNDDFATPPSVDEAFQFSAQTKDNHTLLVQWLVAEGNYLYRDKINLTIENNNAVKLLEYSLPAGENKVDDIFGLTEVYHHDVEMSLPISRSNIKQEFTLKARYQGCSETFNICYPPTEKTILLSLPEVMDSETKIATAASNAGSASSYLSSQDRIAKSLEEDKIITILLSFFGLGLLLAFTPCVFPMIPILSSIIVGEGERITTYRAFILSLTYILAMSVTYTVAGVMTGLLGENLQSMFQNPWIIGSFSALFVVLALSMFGLFELQLPHGLQHRLHQISHQQKGGHVMGAALMGLLSALIVGPCLAPPLAGALIFIGQQGDPILGGSALFALSMGMGLPLLIIGTSAGTLLPKAGDWMDIIKSIFGVLMLALAIWMLERIIPSWISLLLWGGLLIISAVYLGALNSLKIDSSGWEKLWKGLGVILLIYGSLLMIGSSSGSQNIWQPLQAFAANQQSTQDNPEHLNFTQVTNLKDLKQQLSQSNTITMLDFYADWCIDCKKMEVTTFKDSEVIKAFSNKNALQLDMTENTAAHQALLKELHIFGPPTMLFFDSEGNEFRQHRLVGSVTATELLNHLANLNSSNI